MGTTRFGRLNGDSAGLYGDSASGLCGGVVAGLKRRFNSLNAMNEPLTIRVAADKSVAHLLLAADAPAEKISAAFVLAAIDGAGVVIDDAMRSRLAEIAGSFNDRPRDIEVEIARGLEPVAGRHARIDWCQGRDPNEPPEPVRNESGAIDHYKQPHFIHVNSGDAIGLVVPETPGNAGRNVVGGAIPAKAGRKLSLTFDEKSIVIDGQNISAGVPGVLIVAAGKLIVTDMIEVKGDIDFSTANVDSDGAVSVRGGVRDRFRVKAKQNIQIGGLVESAFLESGGDIVLTRGMAGRSNGSIKCRGNLTAVFLHATTMLVEGNLTIGREMMGCVACIGGHVIGKSATVIGGTLDLGGSAMLGTIGTPGEAPTMIRMGGNPSSRYRIAELRKEIKELERHISEARHRVKQIESLGKLQSPTDKERLTEDYYMIDGHSKTLDACGAELKSLQSSATAKKIVTVSVEKIIHPSVRFEAGEVSAVIRKAIKGPVRIALVKSDSLMVSVAGGAMRPIGEFAQMVTKAA